MFSERSEAQEPCKALLQDGLLQDGLIENSDYSGIAAERESKRPLTQVLREDYNFNAPAWHTRACDIDRNCQQVLCKMSVRVDNSTCCVLTDIRQQVHTEAQSWCAAIDPASPANTHESFSLEEMKDRYNKIREYCLKNLSWAVNQD